MPTHLNEETYLDLVSRAYEAALEPPMWETLLTDLAAALGATGAASLFFDQRNGAFARGDVIGMDPEAVRQYADHYASICPRYVLAKSHQGGAVYDDSRISSERTSAFSEYYDFTDRFEISSTLGIVIENSSELMAGFNLYRPRRDDQFGEGEREFLRKLHGHLRRAARLSLEVAGMEVRAAAYDSMFEALNYGVLLLDHNGLVISLNSRAEELLRICKGHIRLRRGGLEISSRADQEKLREAIAAASSPLSVPHHDGAPFLISCPGAGALRVCVLSLPAKYGEHASRIYRLINPPRMMVAISEVVATPEGPLLQRLFGLTPTEADIASRLATGQDVEAIAEARKVSQLTVRVQLKTLFAKLEVRSQAQLVRKVILATNGPFGRTRHAE